MTANRQPDGSDITVKEVVDAHLGFRAKLSVSEAADATIAQFKITPSSLVDAFNAAHLDMTRSSAEAEAIHKERNDLLSHFNG